MGRYTFCVYPPPALSADLFASGRDYRATLLDYTLIGGSPSLAPASVYGVWWSHWEAFSQVRAGGGLFLLLLRPVGEREEA